MNFRPERVNLRVSSFWVSWGPSVGPTMETTHSQAIRPSGGDPSLRVLLPPSKALGAAAADPTGALTCAAGRISHPLILTRGQCPSTCLIPPPASLSLSLSLKKAPWPHPFCDLESPLSLSLSLSTSRGRWNLGSERRGVDILGG